MSKTKKNRPVSPSDKPPGRTTGLLGLTALIVGVILVATGTANHRISVPVTLPKFPESSRVSFQREDIGAATTSAKRTTNVQMVDFDKDGLMDILVCDAARNAVSALASFPRHQVTTYLNTLWLQEPERWSILEKAAEAS